MKAVIFLPNWVGDVVMATPTIRALRKYIGKDSKLIGIMKPYLYDVLKGTSWLDEVWFYDHQSSGTENRTLKLIWRIYREKIDLSILLRNDFSSARISWFGRAKERVGYVRRRRGPFLTKKIYPLMANKEFIPVSTLDYYLKLVYAIGCPTESPKMELATTDEDEKKADQVCGRLGLRSDRRVVAFNSSGVYGQAKLWPDEYFGELAKRIVNERGQDVLIICGPQELQRASRIATLAGGPRVFSLANQEVSIGLSKALIRRSQLLVTTDSGPRHFAAAFDIPLITLFGPTNIAWSDIHYHKEVCLQIPVDCGPCQRRTCPLEHHNCMRNLSVDQVYRTVCNQLEK